MHIGKIDRIRINLPGVFTMNKSAFEKLKLHLKKMRKSAKFKSITAHLKSLNARTNLDILKNIEALLIDVNEYLHLLNSDELSLQLSKTDMDSVKIKKKLVYTSRW